jgi:hypothetical protein
MPALIARATSSADKDPLKESGAITTTGAAAPDERMLSEEETDMKGRASCNRYLAGRREDEPEAYQTRRALPPATCAPTAQLPAMRAPRASPIHPRNAPYSGKTGPEFGRKPRFFAVSRQ